MASAWLENELEGERPLDLVPLDCCKNKFSASLDMRVAAIVANYLFFL